MENFKLRSIKITSKGVEISWSGKEQSLSLVSKTPVHPDLTKAINRLRKVFGAVFGFKDSAFAVTGASFKGEDEKAGMNVTGRFKTESGKEIGLSTQRMLFTDDYYGFEHELEEIKGNIEGEAYLYVYENKSSQTSLEFDEDQEEVAEEVDENA